MPRRRTVMIVPLGTAGLRRDKLTTIGSRMPICRRTLLWLVALAVPALAAGGLLVASAGGTPGAHRAVSSAPAAQAPAGSRLRTRFTYFAAQHTNVCSLQSADLLDMASSTRLQGSCCFPMNFAAYRAQVDGLTPYAAVHQIPRDPYDVSAALAQRLLAYRDAIRLSSSQTAEHERAMRMTPEKGPCCCHCWRWEAFRGMSDYLIARRHWNAAQVAHVISLVDGCGGPRSSA